jgi:acyl carrier protein
MTREDIAEVVVTTISDTFDHPKEAIDSNTVAEDVDGWDSLSHTILMVRLQNRLGTKIPEAVAATSPTVGALIDNLHTLLRGPSA